MDFVKKSSFLSCTMFFFWANQARKNSFLVFWINTNPFWTKKSTKNQNFPKEQVYGFGQKIELFIVSVFWANQDREDRFFVILDKKKSF